ncbi:MAG: formate/nitrite transporter family protein [Oscillospiraceae bacterium]|nr:formate/nitrite transporter family protein [Oscillospiraceae bacterium]
MLSTQEKAPADTKRAYIPEILGVIAERAVQKSRMSFCKTAVFGILAGLFISMGSIASLRVLALDGSFFLSAAVFPVGLVFVILAGAELATGNMLIMSVGAYLKSITVRQLLFNWAVVLIANLLGSLAAAYLFGHYAWLTSEFSETLFFMAGLRVRDSFPVAFVSGILCNIFVCLAVWLSFTAKDFTGKFLAIWFVITVFILSGSQHVVANMFTVPAAIFAGADITWTAFWLNFMAVALGNAVGGAGVVGALYTWRYRQLTIDN